jgi:hypothetical protein
MAHLAGGGSLTKRWLGERWFGMCGPTTNPSNVRFQGDSGNTILSWIGFPAFVRGTSMLKDSSTCEGAESPSGTG